MVRNRDEFSQKVKDRLSRRVSLRCSNPDCRVPTAGPGETEMKISSIGVAAHIHAAAPGGPRYDPAMTPAERSSISNAIWLCANCSIFIDRDESRYTTMLLKEWKKVAEETAIREQGKKLPAEQDAVKQTTMALTGLSEKFLPKAISNVHAATEKAVEILDPRFKVKTNYIDGKTVFEYHALDEDVSFDIKVKGGEGVEAVRRLLEEGVGAKLSAKDIDLGGFNLPGFSLSDAGSLEIKKNAKKSIQKIWLVEPSSGIIEPFDDVVGGVAFGSKAITFEGASCEDLFCVNYTHPLSTKANDLTSNFIITLNFPKWDGGKINNLPYFKKIIDFFQRLVAGWDLYSSLEIHGNQIFKAKTTDLDKSDKIIGLYSTLLYIENAKMVAEKTKTEVVFKSEFSYTAEEAEKLDNAARIFKGEMVFNEKQIKSNPRFSLVLECDGAELVKQLSPSSSTDLKMTEDGGCLSIFGEEISLPDKVTYIKSVYITPPEGLGMALKGDEVSFECMPADGYEISHSYKE